MVSVSATDLSLTYRVRDRLTFRTFDKRLHLQTGGTIFGSGAHRFIVALDGVNFHLEAGDRLGLVGGNGAGKTTLLKVLFGIYEPTRGSLNIRGRIDALFNINLGFRQEATGRRNILLRGLINGWTKDQIAERTEEIIEFSELGEFIDMPLKIYSQGMAARLAFSIATAMDPEILLMDEWIGAGDASFQAKAKQRMNELAEKAGIIIIASHNADLLNKTCNKRLELEKGRVKSYG